MYTVAIVSLVFSTIALTASALLVFITTPTFLAALIETKTRKVLVPAAVIDALAGQENYQLSAENLENPSSLIPKSERQFNLTGREWEDQ